MSKFEKAKSVYLSISFICTIIYLVIGAIAGVVYGVRYVMGKLQSHKAAAKLIDDQIGDSVNGVDDDEVVEHLKAAGWDYV